MSAPPTPPANGIGWPLVPGTFATAEVERIVGNGFQRQLARAREALLGTLYPPTCPGCDSVDPEAPGHGDPRQLCPDCHDRLVPVSAPYCNSCGEPFPIPTPQGFRCSNCGGRRLPFEFAIAPCLCEDLLLDLIHRFKYRRAWTLRQPLARLMLHAFAEPRVLQFLEAPQTVWLVPVPIHWRRERQRGYNQAALLADALGRLTGLPVSNCLSRTVHTKSQATLQRQARMRNLRQAFSPRRRPWLTHPQPGDRVILIDDVFTTGSTAAACARTLKRGWKVDKVVVITAGRG